MSPSAAVPGIAAMALAVALAAACVPGPAAPPPPSGKAAPVALRPATGSAVLVSGAERVKGLPCLERNAIAALAGEYAFLPAGSAEGAEPLRVSVWFTREPVVLPADWAEPGCKVKPTGFSLAASPADSDGSSYWSLDAGSHRLFARVPGGMADPCRFAKVLAERFSFFYRYAERPEDVSFPATLEVGK